MGQEQSVPEQLPLAVDSAGKPEEKLDPASLTPPTVQDLP